MNEYGTVTGPDTVRLERLLPGPIERVWEYSPTRRNAANGLHLVRWSFASAAVPR
jgi:hypothetical protein